MTPAEQEWDLHEAVFASRWFRFTSPEFRKWWRLQEWLAASRAIKYVACKAQNG